MEPATIVAYNELGIHQTRGSHFRPVLGMIRSAELADVFFSYFVEEKLDHIVASRVTSPMPKL